MRALAWACVALGALAASAETLHWPLDLPREVTSSFGEYRPGRFHAGIDLRTGGIGQPVRCAGDGHVSRLRCSPYGYGKAIYVTLDDGYTVVYGHLDDYRDDLRAHVRAEQHRAKDYTVDITVPPGMFRVKRGEVIAKSGQTGIGVPHLHWEIRDPQGRLVNPRLLGLDWPDATRPVAQQLLVWPEDGTVNADIVPQVLPLTHHGEGRYTAAPCTITGRFALGIEAIDPEPGGAKLGLHTAEATLGGQPLFTVRNDYLDYETNSAGGLAFCMPVADRGQFLTLWRWPGNNAPNYSISSADGIAVAPRGATEATITLTDFAGNRATVTVPIQPGEDRPPAPGPPGTGRGTVVAQAWDDVLTLTFRFDQPEGEIPSGEIMQDGQETPLAFVRAGQRTYRAAFRPAAAGLYTLRARHPRAEPYEARCAVFLPGQPAPALEAGGLRVTAKPDAPYGALFLIASPAPEAPQDPIRRLGPAWRLGPEGQPMRAAITLDLPAPGDAINPKRAAIYRSSGGGWSHLDTTAQAGRLQASTTRLGYVTVLEDTLPPVITGFQPGADGPVSSRRPVIRAKISDIGSGIAKYALRCGEQWLLTAYDPEQSLLTWERDTDLPPGTQELRLTLTDTAGNTRTLTRTVSVP